MLEKAYHLISGYVEFRVLGDGARLFTIAAKQGTPLWGFRREGDYAVACTKPRDYRRMRQMCRRCGVRTRVICRHGAPFQAQRVWARKGMLLGTALGAALYMFLSGSVWGVSVSGTERVTAREVLSAAEAAGVYVGASKQELEPKVASHEILTRLPELSWASVNTDGCFVELAVKEGTGMPEREQRQELSNIVAAREGKIVEIEAMEGRPEVELGQAVTEGQLLIAGLYQEVPDPYGPQPDELYQRAGAARGRVIAETYREFSVQVSANQSQQLETGREVHSWLEAFGLRIPLGIWERPEGKARSWQEESRLELLGVELPIAIQRHTLVSLEEMPRTLSEEELREAALLKLREAQKAALPEGSSISWEKLEYSLADGSCFLSAKCRCREEIGKLQVIQIE